MNNFFNKIHVFFGISFYIAISEVALSIAEWATGNAKRIRDAYEVVVEE